MHKVRGCPQRWTYRSLWRRLHALPASEVVARLATDPSCGLTAAEARRGSPASARTSGLLRPPVPWWRKLLAQFPEPARAAPRRGRRDLVRRLGVRGPPRRSLRGAGDFSRSSWQRDPRVPAGGARRARGREPAQDDVGDARSCCATASRTVVAVELLVPGDVVVIGEGASGPGGCSAWSRWVAQRTIEAALTGESSRSTSTSRRWRRRRTLADRVDMLLFGYRGDATGHGLAVVIATGHASEVRPHR